MPVDVVMPRREKRRSARRLISGLTRNAIVADAMSDCFQLFDNIVYYSIIVVRKQVGHFFDEGKKTMDTMACCGHHTNQEI